MYLFAKIKGQTFLAIMLFVTLIIFLLLKAVLPIVDIISKSLILDVNSYFNFIFDVEASDVSQYSGLTRELFHVMCGIAISMVLSRQAPWWRS